MSILSNFRLRKMILSAKRPRSTVDREMAFANLERLAVELREVLDAPDLDFHEKYDLVSGANCVWVSPTLALAGMRLNDRVRLNTPAIGWQDYPRMLVEALETLIAEHVWKRSMANLLKSVPQQTPDDSSVRIGWSRV